MGQPGPDQRRSDDEILREMLIARGPATTATELADRLNYSRQNVARILDRLENEGLVASKQVGARAKVWWPTEQGKTRAAQSDSPS